LAAVAVLTLLAIPVPAGAMPPIGREPPPPSCVGNVTVSFHASRLSVPLGETTTLHWNVRANGCNVTQTINGASVARTGSRVETPTSNRTWTLTVRQGPGSRSWSAPVTVTLPEDAYGRINVTITSNDQVGLFVQAVSSAESTNAIVNIEDHVSLDLSYRADIHLYPGVQIVGGRTSTNPGPLLFTTTYPTILFRIGGPDRNADNVRISGIRLQGADPSVAPEDTPYSTGIRIDSSLNVEIDNNEIYGWHIAGLSVHDGRNRIDRRNGRGAVRIHHNDIHHNQRYGEGYGVEVMEGAYALVEKNSFDFNRHAIAGDGSYGAGYFFYRNVVGSGGGRHQIPGQEIQTHQIDMHGQDEWCPVRPVELPWWDGCWDGYGGVAGEYMDVRYNAILYNAGTALKLRGTPTQRMDVAYNYFEHSDVWGNWYDYGALEQTDGPDRINQWGNTFGGRGVTGFGSICDFDGDGVNDGFAADGAQWRFVSGQGFYGSRYLNTSTLHAQDLEFIDVDSDGICDVRVRADGRVSLGGRTPLERLQRTDILSRSAAAGQLRITHLDGGVITSETYHAVSENREVVATGDFDGDGDSDILLRRTDVVPWTNGEGSGRPTTVFFLQDGAVASYDNWGISPVGGGVEGVADFDGDGTSDVLWRDENGRLKLWYWGVSANVDVSRRNEGEVVGPEWRVQAVGDFDGDGYPDIAWRDDDGQVAIWLMVGSIYRFEVRPGGANFGLDWTIQGVGDFDADGRSDLLWRHSDGGLAIWFKGSDIGAAYPSWRNLGNPTDPGRQISGVSDFNRDGRSDILWRHTDGRSSIWMMQGGLHVGESPYFSLDNTWQVQGLLPVR
jgi:hypothetical protein